MMPLPLGVLTWSNGRAEVSRALRVCERTAARVSAGTYYLQRRSAIRLESTSPAHYVAIGGETT